MPFPRGSYSSTGTFSTLSLSSAADLSARLVLGFRACELIVPAEENNTDMRISGTSLALAAGVLMAAGTPNAKAGPISEVLTNGDFQSGMLNPWMPFATANGTTDGSPNLVSFNTTGDGTGPAVQFSVGEQTYTGQPAGGGIDQKFTLGSDGTFNFFADIAAQNTFDLPNADAGTFSILIDGIPLASSDLGYFAFPCTGSCNQILTGTLSGAVTLDAGVHTFEVLITRDFLCCGDVDQYVNNISLTAAPEPPTLSMASVAGLALAVLALHRRRMRPR
jgi:hypothetical protein